MHGVAPMLGTDMKTFYPESRIDQVISYLALTIFIYLSQEAIVCVPMYSISSKQPSIMLQNQIERRLFLLAWM